MGNKENYIFLKNNFIRINKELNENISNNNKKDIIIKLQLMDHILKHMNKIINKMS